MRLVCAVVALSLLACGGATSTPTIVTPVDAPRIAAPAWTGAPLPRATMRRLADDLPAPGVDLLVRAGELVAGAADDEVIVWDRGGVELRRVPSPELMALAVSAAGLVAVAGLQEVVVTDVRTGEVRLRTAGVASDVALSADGAWLAIATEEHILVVEIASPETARKIVPEYGADAVGFSPDGATLWSSDAFAHHAWEVATGAELAKFGGGFASEFKLREGVIWVFLDGVDPPQRYDAVTYARIADLTLPDLVYTGDLDAQRLVLDAYAVDPVTKKRAMLVPGEIEDIVLPSEGEAWYATGTELQRWRDLPEARLVDGPILIPRPGEDPGDVIVDALWTAEGLAVGILAGPRVRRYGQGAPVDVTVPCQTEGCEILRLEASDGAIDALVYDETIWRVEGAKASNTGRPSNADEEAAPLVGLGGVRLLWEYDALIVQDDAGAEQYRVPAQLQIADVAVSPDGRWAAIADISLRLVDLQTGREVSQVTFAEDYGVDLVTFSPDGSQIAAVQTWSTGDHVWAVPLEALTR